MTLAIDRREVYIPIDYTRPTTVERPEPSIVTALSPEAMEKLTEVPPGSPDYWLLYLEDSAGIIDSDAGNFNSKAAKFFSNQAENLSLCIDLITQDCYQKGLDPSKAITDAYAMACRKIDEKFELSSLLGTKNPNSESKKPTPYKTTQIGILTAFNMLQQSVATKTAPDISSNYLNVIGTADSLRRKVYDKQKTLSGAVKSLKSTLGSQWGAWKPRANSEGRELLARTMLADQGELAQITSDPEALAALAMRGNIEYLTPEQRTELTTASIAHLFSRSNQTTIAQLKRVWENNFNLGPNRYTRESIPISWSEWRTVIKTAGVIGIITTLSAGLLGCSPDGSGPDAINPEQSLDTTPTPTAVLTAAATLTPEPATAAVATPEPTDTAVATMMPPATDQLNGNGEVTSPPTQYEPSIDRLSKSLSGEVLDRIAPPGSPDRSALDLIINWLNSNKPSVDAQLRIHADPEGKAWTAVWKKNDGSILIPHGQSGAFQDLMGLAAYASTDTSIDGFVEVTPQLDGQLDIYTADGYVYIVEINPDTNKVMTWFDTTWVDPDTGEIGRWTAQADDYNTDIVYSEARGGWFLTDANGNFTDSQLQFNPETSQWQEGQAIGEVRQGEEILQVWDGQEWVDMHRNIAVLNGELKLYNESSNQWSTYPISPELQQVIASENWELRKVSLSEARNKQFLVIENQEGNPVLTWDEFKWEFVRSYYADYYGRGPLRIYPAIEFQVIDPELLEQRINSLGQVVYRPYTLGSHFNDLTHFMAIDNLLITGINHHAVSEVGTYLTEVEVVFKTPTGELANGTLVYKKRTVLRLPSRETPTMTPPHLGIEPGDIITSVAEYFPPEYTPGNPDPDKRTSYQLYRDRFVSPPVLMASFLWDEARISTDQLQAVLQDHRWGIIGDLEDQLLLLQRIEITDRP
jgi:hypothetical protein